MSDYSIVNAYFAEQAQAARACDQLKSFGYGESHLHIFDQQTEPAPEAKPKNNFIEGLTHMFSNREIGQIYSYGPRDARFLLRIEANEARAEEALRILEALSPFETTSSAAAPAAPAVTETAPAAPEESPGAA